MEMKIISNPSRPDFLGMPPNLGNLLIDRLTNNSEEIVNNAIYPGTIYSKLPIPVVPTK